MAFIYTLELLQTVLSTRDAFRVFGTGWGDLNGLDGVGWLWFSVPVLVSLSKSEISARHMAREAHLANSQLH